MKQNLNIEAEGQELNSLFTINTILKKTSGVYCISINKNFYIGSAVNLYQRLHSHKSQLLKNKHPNTHLQKAFNKYNDVHYSVFKLCNKEDLIKEEQLLIDKFSPKYNIRKEASSNLGLKMSDECKKKHSKRLLKWHKEIGFSEEVKNKIGKANSLIKRTEEQKEHLRKMSTGRKHTEAAKEKNRQKAIIARKTSTNYNFKGENNPQSKLKDYQVKEIIEKLKLGVKGVTIAKQYNVSTFCISLIKLNKSYKHIER